MYASRAIRLNMEQSAIAWQDFARSLSSMGEMDMPKFADLVGAVRRATIAGRQIR